MLKRWVGPAVTASIFGGVAFILAVNLEKGGSPTPTGPLAKPASPTPQAAVPGAPAGFREYPIGDEVVKNHLRIAAVWLPSVQFEGQGVVVGSDVIHLEADVKATEGNPNGFAKDEKVPYLRITYTIVPAEGGTPIQGLLTPMVARDGLHYGASLSLPKPGLYRLIYAIEPPSVNGLGRHHDPATGVAPWWEPFEVSFDWDYQGLPASGTDAGTP